MRFLLLFSLFFTPYLSAHPLAKPVIKTVELISQQASKSGGKLVAKEGFTEALQGAYRAYGDQALYAARLGGPDLSAAVARSGPEVMAWAAKVPKSASALAQNSEILVPLVRKNGTTILELEAKVPGIAKRAHDIYPARADIEFINQLPAQKAKQLVAYAAKADTPTTTRKLIQEVKKDPSLLERLNSRQIAAAGLSVALISGATISSSALPILAKDMPTEEISDVFTESLRPVSWGISLAIGACGLALASGIYQLTRRFFASRRQN